MMEIERREVTTTHRLEEEEEECIQSFPFLHLEEFCSFPRIPKIS